MQNRFEALGVEVRAVRRRGAKAKLLPAEAGELQAGDAVVLLGAPEALAGTLPGACHAEQGGVPVPRRTGGRA